MYTRHSSAVCVRVVIALLVQTQVIELNGTNANVMSDI